MIDIKTDFPIREDCLRAIQDRNAQIRDLLIEIEQILGSAVKEDVLMTAQEVADYYRTDTKHIPKGIPKMRRGKDYLYSRGDVVNYAKTKLKRYK